VLPQKHAGLALLPTLSIKNSILCPHARFVHSHHSLFFFCTAAYLSPVALRFSPFCRSPSRPARSGSINGSRRKEARTHPIPLEGHAHAVLEEKTTSLAITTGLLDDSRVRTPRLASDRLTSPTSGISARTRIGRTVSVCSHFACKSCSLISTNLFRAQVILSVKRFAPISQTKSLIEFRSPMR
jgi:hypothetical protein